MEKYQRYFGSDAYTLKFVIRGDISVKTNSGRFEGGFYEDI